VILFSLAAALIDGFRLKNGLSSAVLGAVAYGVLSTVFIRLLGLGDVELIRAALA
jgi:putative membrane protein